jgi:hypothetical protein
MNGLKIKPEENLFDEEGGICVQMSLFDCATLFALVRILLILRFLP